MCDIASNVRGWALLLSVMALVLVASAAGSRRAPARSGGFALGAGCDTDSQCGSDLGCLELAPNLDRQCAARCSSTEACQLRFGERSQCVATDVCVVRCDSNGDCPRLTVCNAYRWCERE
ncbi:MAG: hypothetical protein MJD61_20735 [Proteobacteria bacterium]|nr:hypothetical protein [Pseudomonadota bacterium]